MERSSRNPSTSSVNTLKKTSWACSKNTPSPLNNFAFGGQFYEQTGGSAMGSPLYPVITNFFMEYFEGRALEEATNKPLRWFTYMDDTFVIWPLGPEQL